MDVVIPSYVVVADLHAAKNRRVHVTKPAEHLFPVTDRSIQPSISLSFMFPFRKLGRAIDKSFVEHPEALKAFLDPNQNLKYGIERDFIVHE